MKQKEIKEYLEKGYVRVHTIFEIVGKPKEHIENTIKAYLANIESDSEIVTLKETYEEGEEIEDGLFSTMAEAELLLSGFEKLTWLCINFSPASVEVLEPKQFSLEQKEVTHWLNDLLSRLHEIGMIQKNLQLQTDALIKNFNAMTRNAILLTLDNENSTIDQITKKIGMINKHTETFLDALIKEKKVVKEGKKYKQI